MKADVLDDFAAISICTKYKIGGVLTEDFPYELDDTVEPIYDSVPGWKQPLTGVTSEDKFPKELSNYIAYLESELQVPISIVSVGPDRSQTIVR